MTMLNDEAREAARQEALQAGRRTFAREGAPALAVVAEEVMPAAAPAPAASTAPAMAPAQTLIDAVTQLEANKKDVTPRGFQKRLQLAYAIFDQAAVMMQEIETQHAKLVNELVAVDRRSPLPQKKPAAK